MGRKATSIAVFLKVKKELRALPRVYNIHLFHHTRKKYNIYKKSGAFIANLIRR